MQEIQQSIQQVTSSPGFLLWVGAIITFGMLGGAKYDESLRGFKRSVNILFPFTLILFLSTVNYLYVVSLDKLLGADAYNSLVRLVIITVFYIFGLLVGHVVVKKGYEAGMKGKKL